MKTRCSTLFAIATLLTMMGASAQAQARFDLSIRKSLFFTEKGTTSIDAAEQAHLWVNNGATMTLKTSQAVKCEGAVCYFNIGDLVWRDVKTGPFTTFAEYVGDDGSIIGNSVVFKDKEEVKTFIMPVKMKLGKNKVTLTIDPENKTAETNETNNSITVYFNVVSDRLKPIKPGSVPKPQEQDRIEAPDE